MEKGVSMGSENNKKFYQIPYCKLLNKLKEKCYKYGIRVEFNEESYTSKCDALSLEPIHKQEKYLGKRIKRGLFSSKIGKLINADLNGAINIMRKYLDKEKHPLKKIEGIDIYNPKIANVLVKHCANK